VFRRSSLKGTTDGFLNESGRVTGFGGVLARSGVLSQITWTCPDSSWNRCGGWVLMPVKIRCPMTNRFLCPRINDSGIRGLESERRQNDRKKLLAFDS